MSKFTIIFISILFTLSAWAEPIEQPMLWKAQKGNQTAYLLGTFHLGVSLSDLPTQTLELIESSATFYMEADVHSIDQEQAQKAQLFQNGQTLDQFMPEAAWSKLSEQLSPVVPADTLKLYEPWAVTQLLALIAMQQLNLQGTLDTELLEYAKNQNVELGYLESADLQFAVLEAISPVHSLVSTVMKSENLVADSASEIQTLFSCYIVSDIVCLEGLLGTVENGGTLEAWQYELILSQRNRTWIPVIEKALKSGQTFVAVGAGHLVGENNVLELLENEGFSIERVQF